MATDAVRQHGEDAQVFLTTHGGHDSTAGDGRAIRYVEWTFDSDPNDTTYTVDFAYLLRENKGPVRVVHDTHVFGIFPRETWLRVLAEAGFEARSVAEVTTDDRLPREFFVGRRPSV